MIFTIDRASTWDDEDKPCEGAEKVSGANEWAIEIKTLDELMALVQREGALILGATDITIYDAHVE